MVGPFIDRPFNGLNKVQVCDMFKTRLVNLRIKHCFTA